MAVKKSAVKKTAKKAPAKKAAAKKVAKKAPAKKKVAAKKVAKKAPAKKVAAKKVAKKAPAKKIAKKAVVKKGTAKKVAKRPSSTNFVVPPVPTSTTRKASTVISTAPAKIATPAPAQNAPVKSGSSNRIVAAVIAAIVILALVVVARNSSSKTESAAPAPTASASAEPSASTTTDATAQTTATPEASATASASGHDAPVGIVAHYTAKGATILWKAPATTTGLASYNVEMSVAGGAYKLLSTVPASQLSLDITKTDTAQWSSFKVSTVYDDGTVVAGKVFGLPGLYE